MPKIIRWNTKRKLLDYETKFRRTVSDRFRALIEEIEPGVHQFEPIRFINKDGSDLAVRWFWQVCNRLASADPETTNYDTSRGVWLRPLLEDARLFFDEKKIGDAKFWHDKHLGGGPFVTNDVKEKIEKAKMSGIHFNGPRKTLGEARNA
ncbi:MAG: DUF1629 domain-containing protein [Pseudomonadota bacterium]